VTGHRKWNDRPKELSDRSPNARLETTSSVSDFRVSVTFAGVLDPAEAGVRVLVALERQPGPDLAPVTSVNTVAKTLTVTVCLIAGQPDHALSEAIEWVVEAYGPGARFESALVEVIE
jgi:hypothetical protein